MAKGALKGDIKNHFQYRLWVYLLIAVAGWFAADLLYTVTAYRPPAERKVDFVLVQGGYPDTEALSAALSAPALAWGQAYDPTLEEVGFYSISYSGDSSADIYGAQVYLVRIAAQEGDIWILPENLFDQLHVQDALMPLDDFVEQGLLHTQGLDLTNCLRPAPSEQTDEDGAPLPPDGEEHLYALPASGLKGLEQIGYQTQDAYLVMMGYSANPQTSAVVLDWVMEQLKEGLPEQEEIP